MTSLLTSENPQKETSFYTDSDLRTLNLQALPKHVAIIMDGNRRWAHSNQLPVQMGHVSGAEQLKTIVQAVMELQIKNLTVYAFSTENNKRSVKEVQLLLALFKKYLAQEAPEMKKNGIKLHTIGNIESLPQDVVEVLEESKRVTSEGDKLNLILAINYGARDEIKRAFEKILTVKKNLDPSELSEDLICKYLDTAAFPDPDLLIRTSGECRLSNFLLWQISYTEIYFSGTLWPNFTPAHLLEALKDFQKREIRRGL